MYYLSKRDVSGIKHNNTCFFFISSGRSAIEHVHHNHTYHLPAESSGSLQRPVSRDKKGELYRSNWQHDCCIL